MNDFKDELRVLLLNRNKMQRLLFKEKERRGVLRDRLAFMGLHNVAQHWWCTQYAVLKSRDREAEFFAGHLEDRLIRSWEVGLIREVPTRDIDILDVGREMTHRQVEKIERKKRLEIGGFIKRSSRPNLYARNITDHDGKQSIEVFDISNPEKLNSVLADLDPMDRGSLLHDARLGNSFTIRWSFNWRGITVVGAPDGMTKTHILEYKSTKNRHMMNFVPPRCSEWAVTSESG